MHLSLAANHLHLILYARFCCSFAFAPSSYLFTRTSKLQRQSSLCHSCRYTRIQHVPSFHTTNISPIRRQDSSIMKTTSSTNLTESLSSSSLVAANAASALSSAAAITENHSNEFQSLMPKHRLSISSLPFSILNGDAGVYGSRISIADDVYEQLCEKPKQPVSFHNKNNKNSFFLSLLLMLLLYFQLTIQFIENDQIELMLVFRLG